MNKKGNDFDLTIKLSTVTRLMIVSGLCSIILSELIIEYGSTFFKNHLFLNFAIKIIEVLSTTLFSAGLVSVLVEISTIRSLVAHAFRNILTGNFELDGLNNESLVRLKQDISLKLLENPTKELSNTPYKYENNLLHLVNKKYYDHHNMTYHITPDEKNNCFHVKTKIDYCIINKRMDDNNFNLRMKYYKVPDADPNNSTGNNFSITVSLNGKTLNTNDIISIEPINHNGESAYYNYKVRVYKELQGIKNNIKAELKYDVPMFDICQSFKISTPCKNIEHKFYINEDIQTGQEWMIQANAYSTFYHKQDEENSNYKVEQNVDDSLIIQYMNWALTGNGYCVFYQKKH